MEFVPPTPKRKVKARDKGKVKARDKGKDKVRGKDHHLHQDKVKDKGIQKEIKRYAGSQW